MRYLIQWDNASKRYPARVVSTSGICFGYFRTRNDAIAWCESQA